MTGTCRVQFNQPITLVGAPKLFFGTLDSYNPSQIDDPTLFAADTIEFHTNGYGFGTPPSGIGTISYDASIDSMTGPGGTVAAFTDFPCTYTNS